MDPLPVADDARYVPGPGESDQEVGDPMRPSRAFAAVAGTALVTGSLVAAPTAAADTTNFTDSSTDAKPAYNIERVKMNNGHRIFVKASMEKIRKDRGGLSVYFDTRGPDRGPEFVVHAGLSDGSDWQGLSIENWNGDDTKMLKCSIRLAINYRQDTARYSIARKCFNRPSRIRVAARASTKPGNTDWAPKLHRFYDWVRH